MFSTGDVVICTDTSGSSILEVERNSEDIIEEVRQQVLLGSMCFYK